MVIIGILLIIIGILLISIFFYTLKWRKIILGVIFVTIGVCVNMVSETEEIYSYKSSEYKVEITYETKQIGDQVICDTIYKFKKK